MRLRCAAVIVLPCAAALVALAQDAPPPPKPGETAPAARKPVQDAAGLAALRRLAELAPTPGSVGVREMRCSALPLVFPLPFQFHVRWAGEREPVVTAAYFPNELVPGGSSAAEQSMASDLVQGAFMFQRMWDPAVVAVSDVSSEREGEELVVTLRDPGTGEKYVLRLGADGLPRTATPPGDSDSDPKNRIRLTFTKVGSVHVLTRLLIGDPLAPRITAEIMYFPARTRFPMPRGIEWHGSDGTSKQIVFRDVVVDGDLVPGTSDAEARAGHPRSVDDGARRAFEAIDREIATPYGAGVRSLSCRVTTEAPGVRDRIRVTWGPEGVTSVEPEPAAPGDPPADLEFLAGRRVGFAFAAGELLRPASCEFDGYDAVSETPADGTASPAPVVLLLTPLAEDGVVTKQRLELDAKGRVVKRHIPPRDGAREVTIERTYAAAGTKSVRTEERESSAGRTSTARWTWWQVAGFPPLIRTLERTRADTKGKQTELLTFTDWVVDGKPVPGTGAADAKPPTKK